MTHKEITQPLVSFGLPIDPQTAELFAATLPRLDEARPGDIVGINLAMFQVAQSVETNGGSFLVMREDRGLDLVDAEEIQPSQFGVAYPLLARLLNADLDNILYGIDLSESDMDGWRLLSLSIFSRAVMVTDTVHDLAPTHPSDLAPNTRLWLPAAQSAHEALALQPFVDAVVAYYGKETLIDDLEGRFEYARVTLPHRAEAA